MLVCENSWIIEMHGATIKGWCVFCFQWNYDYVAFFFSETTDSHRCRIVTQISERLKQLRAFFFRVFFARIINMMTKIITLTGSHWSETSEPRLRANWNSGELCAACCHARRSVAWKTVFIRCGTCNFCTTWHPLFVQMWCLESLNYIIWVRTKMKREKRQKIGRKEAMKKKNRSKRKQKKK
jgi:hypothetical protein